MTNITIGDLDWSKELNKKALTSIQGGLLLPAVQAARESARRTRWYGGPDTKKRIIAILIG